MQQVLIFPQIRRLKICLVSIIALAKLHAHASPMRPSLGIWQYLFFDSLIQHLVQGSAFLNQLVHLASFVHVDHTRISGITFMITLVGPCFFDLILASAQDATAYDLHMAASFIFMQVRS